ncbi:MAG: hypothetical protein WC520_00120 [Candidatus Paceibacterota bacterium]
MDLNKFFQSKTFSIITWSVAGLILVLLVFSAGMSAGFKKASFSYKWGENYYRNFAGPAPKFPGNMPGHDEFMGAHGIIGQIIKIDGSTLVIKDRENTEKTVVIKEGVSVLRRLREDIKLTDLKVDDFIVVIGEPDSEGQIEAKLVRILPSPEQGLMPPPNNDNNAQF